jgi:exodeoxyribonuclease VII large subunit
MSEQPAGQTRNIRQTNALVRALVEQETLGYPFWIGGYVSRHFVSDLGHEYFDLNDEGYSIKCMIREAVRGALTFTISNGMDIEVYGAIRLYEKAARVQIEVENARLISRPQSAIDPNLIPQLEQKGLWPKPKRPLPEQIAQIGLITSKQSDALHDFEDTYRREGGTAAIKLVDVRLQGPQAVRDIANAINRLNHENRVNVIVLIRGGGRASELAIFDDLLIAEAMCRSAIPIVTGIGHHRNETFADRVADVATITPTAAASHLVKHQPVPVAQPQPKSQWAYALIGVAVLLLLFVFLALSTRQP